LGLQILTWINHCGIGVLVLQFLNGKSLATLELKIDSSGSMIDAAGQRWAVKQFRGKKNTAPTEEAKAAWNKFVILCEAKQVKFYSPKAVAQNDHSQIPEISRITGVYPQESPARIVEHYLGIFMADKAGNRIPLIKRGSYAYENARFCLD
jgi:hypothetical protein